MIIEKFPKTIENAVSLKLVNYGHISEEPRYIITNEKGDSLLVTQGEMERLFMLLEMLMLIPE